MFSFVNFSSKEEGMFLVIDEDAFYKWTVPVELVQQYIEWMGNRDVYKFRLSFEGGDTYISVRRDGVNIVREKVTEAEYL